MWKTKCQACKWTSGEAYLRSVAEAMGTLHVEDNRGHEVVTRQVSTFGVADDEEDNPTPEQPEPSKP